MSSNTLIPFELDFTDLDETKPYKDYRKELLDKLKAEGQRHFNYYDKLRAKRSPYVQSRRWLAAVLGALGAVLTAAGTALRVTQTGSDLDLYALVAAVLCYGLMSSISLYEKFTDTTSSYFRYLGILLGLRSLWDQAAVRISEGGSGARR